MPKRTDISSILIIGAAACTPNLASPEEVRAELLADLAGITERCRLPATTLRLTGTDELRILPPADASYQSVDCVLAGIRDLPYRLNLGFTGNEALPAREAQ